MISGSRFRVSHWATTHEKWIWLLFTLLLVVGSASYFRLPVHRFPTVQLPAVAISVSAGAEAPAELERGVTVPIEQSVRHLPGIRKIYSQISTGSATTVAQFDSGLANQPLPQRIKPLVEGLGAGRPVSVRRLEVDSTPMLSYAVTSGLRPTPMLSAYVDELVLPKLRKVPGVHSAKRLGGSDQHLEVLLQPRAMSLRMVTPLAVSQSLKRWARASRAAGTRTAQSLRELAVPTVRGNSVRLAQIATIEEAPDIASHVLFDDEPAVGFQITKSADADALKVDRAVADLARELQQERQDTSFTKIWSTADETGAALQSTKRALLEGMLLAALVVFLFLRDLRATLVVAVAMPLSLIPTFALFYVAGFSLNLVTLLALTLAVGILVDDAIVEVENIQRLVRAGTPPRRAAPDGADRIALAVVATTAAIVAVFAPVSFMPGVAGRFFFEFGLTVSAAVIMSLLVARLLTPVLAARLLRPANSAPPANGGISYGTLLSWALRKRRTAIFGGLGVVAASIALVPLLPTEFQPAPDPDFYFVSVVADPGAGIEGLQALAKQAREIVAARAETKHVLTHLGATAEGGGAAGISLGSAPFDPRSARLAVAVESSREASLAAIRAELRPAFGRLTGGRVFSGPPSGMADLQVLLAGDDPTSLAQVRGRLLDQLTQLPLVVDARPLLPGVDAGRESAVTATATRIEPVEYQTALTLATAGTVFPDALTDDGSVLPVHLRIAAPRSLEQLPDVPVRGVDGKLISLSATAPSADELRSTILRLDGRRVDGIEADVAFAVRSGDVMAAIQRLPVMQDLPLGISLVPTGDQEELDTLFRSMAAAFLAAAVAVYGTLALLFRSFVLPLIIVSALPLALGGAVLGLLISGSALNLPALIGFLLLLGLAAKNSILLVEHAARRVREGMSARDSIIEACYRRSRPIVMTSVAMAAGMLPAAVTLGAGDEFRQPMAFAVIGGLISSTILSLLFVPALFDAVFGRRHSVSNAP